MAERDLDGEKVDYFGVSKTPPCQTHTVVDLAQDAVLAKIATDQHDLPEPAKWCKVGLRSRLDIYRTISDTGHAYLLVENRCLFSLQGGTFLCRLATGHISLRNSWEQGAIAVSKWASSPVS